jgi:predicted transcriptional regulator of viral defense system
MRYAEFKNRVLNLPLVTKADTPSFGKDAQIIRNQFQRWVGKGLLIRLKRGMYILNSNDRKIDPDKEYIANRLYEPSYVSLEYALNFYGLIPERVIDITSVTTKKTARFKNAMGSFVYQHIKPDAFRGFKAVSGQGGLVFFIAEPEKAICDFFYLNLKEMRAGDKEIFKDSYRFQNTETLNQKRIIELSLLFNNDRLRKVSIAFCEFVKGEKKHD